MIPGSKYFDCDSRVDRAISVRGDYDTWGVQLEPACTWYHMGTYIIFFK